VAALEDELRRGMYAFIRAARRPVTRDEAAASVGISRKLAAFHLDKLVAAGVLRARVEALGPRRVGRAPKVYELGRDDISVHLPPREPGLLVDILLDAVRAPRRADSPDASSADAVAVVLDVARDRGERVGRAERERVRPGRVGAERSLALMSGLLERHGFEPALCDAGINLRNCPFHPHVSAAPELVCGLNHAYLDGLISGLGAQSAISAVLEPGAAACCVRVRPAARPATRPSP
jgi:predicted ArsR family transcriptional regulator